MNSDRNANGQHAKRAVRATFWSAINSIIPIITNLGVFVVTARILSPHDFGVVAFATGLALLGAALCPGGLGEAIIQRLEISERQLSSVFWLCMASAAAVFVLECALAASLARFFKMEALALLIPVISTRIMADMAAVVPSALLARAMNFRIIAFRTFVVSIIAAGIAIGLLLAGFGIWALVVSQLTSSYIVALVSFWACKWHPRLTFSTPAVKELLGYGLYSSGTQTLSRVFQQNEQILVGLLLGATQLGFYTFSKQVLTVFNNVVAGSLGSVAHPMFSGIQNDIERVKKGFLSATFVSSLVAFPMFTGLALVAPHIVPLAFGPRWLPDVPLIQLQCAFGLSTCIGTLQAGLITSQGKANWWFYYQLAVTLTTALTIILFARYGLTVMLFAMWMKTYVMWAIPIRITLRLLSMPIKKYVMNFRTPAVATAAMAIAIQTVNIFIHGQSDPKALIFDTVSGVAVYSIVAFIIDSDRINAFILMISPRFRKVVKAV
jgi:O-antigen/teichoic acid export membrane protein